MLLHMDAVAESPADSLALERIERPHAQDG